MVFGMKNLNSVSALLFPEELNLRPVTKLHKPHLLLFKMKAMIVSSSQSSSKSTFMF